MGFINKHASIRELSASVGDVLTLTRQSNIRIVMSRIVEDRNTFYFPICNTCKWKGEDLMCEAFDKIPDEILFGENDHSKPLPEQKNKITYQLKGN